VIGRREQPNTAASAGLKKQSNDRAAARYLNLRVHGVSLQRPTDSRGVRVEMR
jgi:hypothetical protein